MKTYLLCVLAGFMLVTPSLVAQNSETASPTIPEEARRHFVIGATLFKDAKTPDDYAQVESQFKQAVDLAPQWPDARYNLALAKEAAGDYSGAMADLKLYLQFKLPDAEARTAQDKIYVIEAKAEEAPKKQAAADAANAQAAKRDNFDGAVFVHDDPIDPIHGYVEGEQTKMTIKGDEVTWFHKYTGVTAEGYQNGHREGEWFQIGTGHLYGKRIQFERAYFAISLDGQSISRCNDDWTIMKGQPVYDRQR
jgi:tetratricopeptide (TPR) repeat protein